MVLVAILLSVPSGTGVFGGEGWSGAMFKYIPYATFRIIIIYAF